MSYKSKNSFTKKDIPNLILIASVAFISIKEFFTTKIPQLLHNPKEQPSAIIYKDRLGVEDFSKAILLDSSQRQRFTNIENALPNLGIEPEKQVELLQSAVSVFADSVNNARGIRD